MTTARRVFVSAIAIVAALASTASVRAEQPDKYTKPHEPFTAYGMQVRMSIVNPINQSWQKEIRPTVFQEIAPCRLSSTFIRDHYETPWGGPGYRSDESRHYLSRGVLETATFVDPCSESIPMNAIGIVGRFTVTSAEGDGEVHIDPVEPASPNAATVLKFKKGEELMFEAGVMLTPSGTFGMATWYAGAEVTVDVLGYLLPDPAPAGAKGDKGDQGDKGETGATGATGAKGDTGAAGAKGDKGDTGATGAKGDKGAAGAKGDKGDAGATGATGAKGDTGATGAKGDKGDTGATGPAGATGAKGDAGAKGDKGDTGAMGAKGDKGDKGDKGATGEKGSVGATGPQGLMGPKGDKGDTGPIGPAGGLRAVKGNGCYPPGNNANSLVTIHDGSVTSSSIVMLNYTDAGSNGNALALVGQGAGYFQTTGSPNNCFQYVVLNTAP
jgi:collagen triple helix repeat protein